MKTALFLHPSFSGLSGFVQTIFFEWDRVLKGFEFDFIVLGLGLHLRWNYLKKSFDFSEE